MIKKYFVTFHKFSGEDTRGITATAATNETMELVKTSFIYASSIDLASQKASQEMTRLPGYIEGSFGCGVSLA